MIFTACSDESGIPGKDTGRLVVNLDIDTGILSAGQSRSSLDDFCSNLSADDFTIRLTDSNGESKEWSYSEFSGENIAIGNYTLTAYSGREGEEGFDKAYFHGSEKVNVRTDESTAVSVTAALANSAVRVIYSEAFRKYMTEYTASVRTDGSTDGVAYPATSGEEDDLFINPGEASLYVTFTTVNGQSATLKAADFTAEPRHRYTVTVDVNGGEVSDAVLNVDFDDTTVAETREFVLSDELFSAPAPVVTPETQSFSVVEGTAPAEGGKINIVAAAGIESVKLVTQSDYLLSKGWPAEVDLIKAGADMQQLLTNLGLNVLGLWKNPDKLAVIDFSKVIANLHGADNNTSTFRVEVVDIFGKVSDPSAMIEVTLDPIEFSITGQDICMAGDEEVTLNVAYNGSDIESAKWEVFHEAAGVWDRVTPTSIQAVSRSSDTVYAVTLPIPATEGTVQIRVTLGSLPTVNFTVDRSIPDYTLSVNANDAYATRALVTVSSDNATPASIIKMLKFTASADGSNLSGLSAKKVADNVVELSGLPAGKAITVKGTLLDKDETATFNTEAALNIPNGDFETLSTALSRTDMNQSGKWSISAGINYQTTVSFTISEPDGWATVNAKTAASSHNPQNTWFVVPSTVNSTLSWLSTVPKIKVIGTGGGTDTPPHFKNLTAQSGSNAMVLRNVGWDPAGSVPGVKVQSGSSDVYYNHTAPDVAQRSAGKLFLGSYSYANGVETYNEGVSFTSRPASLTGYYKFERDAADANETGMVTVEVLSGTQVIAQASKQLEPAADFTLFTLPLSYANGAPKATQVKVMFASSNHASYNQADESANVKTSNYMSRYECYALGAALTVDNLKFNY